MDMLIDLGLGCISSKFPDKCDLKAKRYSRLKEPFQQSDSHSETMQVGADKASVQTNSKHSDSTSSPAATTLSVINDTKDLLAAVYMQRDAVTATESNDIAGSNNNNNTSQSSISADPGETLSPIITSALSQSEGKHNTQIPRSVTAQTPSITDLTPVEEPQMACPIYRLKDFENESSIVVEVELPGVSSAAEIDADIEPSQLEISVLESFYLFLPLPHDVDPDACTAKFCKATSTLTLRLPYNLPI